MKIERGKNRIPILIPIASMGDIAFLLIIFFMLTSNFIKEGHVEVDPAASRDVEQVTESGVSVSIDASGAIWLQGTPCPVELLGQGVEALLSDREDNVVMLKVDRSVPQSTYGRVILDLSKAGAELALVGVRE